MSERETLTKSIKVFGLPVKPLASRVELIRTTRIIDDAKKLGISAMKYITSAEEKLGPSSAIGLLAKGVRAKMFKASTEAGEALKAGNTEAGREALKRVRLAKRVLGELKSLK